MTSSLCHLVFLPEMWGSWVLSKLTLLDMVRLETAVMNYEYGPGLLRSYRVLPPINFPLTRSTVNRELCWKWLFGRGFISKRILLDKVYLESTTLQMLLVDNAHALAEGIKTIGFDHPSCLTFLSTTHPALLEKVFEFSLSSWSAPASAAELPNVRLPFNQLIHFYWNSQDIDHQCLISALEDNLLLERLSVKVDLLLPVAFFPALSLRGSTLTSLRLEANDLTDANMHEIGQHCRSLTDLDLPGYRSTHVTDAGIAALAKGCVDLRNVNITYNSLTGDSLAALFTHCLHLHRACCHRVPINDAAVMALCSPARAAVLDELECFWHMPLHLTASFYKQAFSGIKRFQLFNHIPPSGMSSLCAALHAMPQLESFSITLVGQTVPGAVLDAVAQGTSVLRRIKITARLRMRGDVEGGLINIARHNPHLSTAWLVDCSGGVTGAVLHAFADNCADFSEIYATDASLVTDASLHALASGCPRLSLVILSNCACLTDRSILALAEHCPLLAYLDVRSSPRVTQCALEQLIRSCKKLQHLEVSGVSMTEEVALRLQSLMPGEQARIYRGQIPAPGWVEGTLASVRQALSRCWAAVAAIGHPVPVHPS
jgi:hypothetical protein